jgi:hypothetical protein
LKRPGPLTSGKKEVRENLDIPCTAQVDSVLSAEGGALRARKQNTTVSDIVASPGYAQTIVTEKTTVGRPSVGNRSWLVAKGRLIGRAADLTPATRSYGVKGKTTAQSSPRAAMV